MVERRTCALNKSTGAPTSSRPHERIHTVVRQKNSIDECKWLFRANSMRVSLNEWLEIGALVKWCYAHRIQLQLTVAPKGRRTVYTANKNSPIVNNLILSPAETNTQSTIKSSYLFKIISQKKKHGLFNRLKFSMRWRWRRQQNHKKAKLSEISRFSRNSTAIVPQKKTKICF